MGRRLLAPETRRNVTVDTRVASWSPTDSLARAPVDAMVGASPLFTLGSVSPAAVLVVPPQDVGMVSARLDYQLKPQASLVRGIEGDPSRLAAGSVRS